ncbi:hypothetical protein DFR86_03080 [Acidianus sulfidivorans JP7]|uniref:Uncharacterized protein n=1 Tax=Acidianus sulfidivorans JP7 TaxID=619593 RepID=A0A2U9IKW9_9CREN|nr:hypothetical protein [Acidianus sulfidivorans]AWR96635.1 hypothetical protein DFR86_03080 [Acidianus sulfidivorans JP7]
MLNLIDLISNDILLWYGRKLKGILLTMNNNADQISVDMLIILENVERLSILSRGDIFNFFFNRLKNTNEFKEYVLKNKKSPKLNGIIISETEISYNVLKILYMILEGYILYDPENILYKKKEEIKANKIKIVNYKQNRLIDLGKVKKGEVLEL